MRSRPAVDRDPRPRRYRGLVGEVTGEPVTVGTAQAWLVDALERSVAGRPSGAHVRAVVGADDVPGDERGHE